MHASFELTFVHDLHMNQIASAWTRQLVHWKSKCEWYSAFFTRYFAWERCLSEV